jgi:hypothetical protein
MASQQSVSPYEAAPLEPFSDFDLTSIDLFASELGKP